MSDIIKLLPDSVANQIAAGEVIQQPSSVIKELVENSVDAGANIIKIIIKDAGRTLIQVIDNGSGMSPVDARMAFERHATSKIKKAEDLFLLTTMGFRGEALPSICAVSQIELKTRNHESAIGTRLVINGSVVETQESVSCDVGTNLMVKNLFFNLPARRRFLKSDATENSRIMREFERLALVNHRIRMILENGNKKIDLKAGSLHQRIEELWKNSLDLHLLPIDIDTSLVKIEGYISRPEYARRRNFLQFLLTNGRNMRHPFFHKIITSCYDKLIATDTQPCYFIKFEVDPSTIDVNIHPTKNEIKFENEQEIASILRASIKAALGKYGATPSIDFDVDLPEIVPLKPGEEVKKPSLEISQSYTPFQTNNSQFNQQNKRNNATSGLSEWTKLYSEILKGTTSSKQEPLFNYSETNNFSASQTKKDILNNEQKILKELSESTGPFLENVCLQYGDSYILTNYNSNLVIIDQYRAHVKILYEHYLKHLRKEEQVSQILMFPDSLRLNDSQIEIFSVIEKELTEMGFHFEYEEENKWKIISVPSIIKNTDPREIILNILDSIDYYEKKGKDEEFNNFLIEKAALAMARSSSIKRQRKLSTEEMESIISELFSLKDPSYTPNGNKIFIEISKKKIESYFQ